jgi:sRNA-binding protein
MSDRPKLTLTKPLSFEKQSQLFQALKPLHEQTEKEKHQHLNEQKKKEREAKQKKREETKITLAWLYEEFSLCFNPKETKPLKLNIDKDLFLFLEKEGSPSKAKLRDALTFYTNNIHYLEAIIKGTHRYDLEGNQVQEITQEQKAYAQEKFERTLQAIRAKKQLKKEEMNNSSADKD